MEIFINVCNLLLLFCQTSFYLNAATLKEVGKNPVVLPTNVLPVKISPITPPFYLGEGPYWCFETQHLYFVDILPGKIYKLNITSGQMWSYTVCNGSASYIIGVENTINHFIVGCGQNMTLIEFDFASATLKPNIQTLTTVDTDRSDTRFNDGKVDTAGRFWGGTMGPEIDYKVTMNRGSLYKIDSTLLSSKIISPVSISNGIAWNSDDNKMYYIDSPTRKIISYNYYSLDGNITSPNVIFDFDEFNLTGVPDGMTIDTHDNLWVANHGGGCVLNIDPRERRILKIIQIPVSRVTSVTFGGRLLDTLFVTTASLNTKQQNSMEPDAGRVFVVEGLGVRGLVSNKFKLNVLNFEQANI